MPGHEIFQGEMVEMIYINVCITTLYGKAGYQPMITFEVSLIVEHTSFF